jgi:hypothetical protein
MRLVFESTALHNTTHTITFPFSKMSVYTHSRADKIFVPSKEFPFTVTMRLQQRNISCCPQISYPNESVTAIVTSTGPLIAALKAREIKKV